MADPEKQLNNLLRDNRFQLVRQTHHKVYRNPEGKVFVTSLTPSDYRWSQNALTTLKKVLVSPPVPEVIAISEFERQQAAAVIQAQAKEPGPGHNKQKHSDGTGILYIPEKKPVIPPETRQKHREHQKLEAMQIKAWNQWESTVSKAQQDFIMMITKKAQPLIIKSAQDYERRRQIIVEHYHHYADTRLRKDMELIDSTEDVDSSRISRMLYAISQIAEDYKDRGEFDQLDEVFDQGLKCSKCVKTETEDWTYIKYCIDHQYEKYRKIGLNIDRFIPRDTPQNDMAAQAKILFRDAINGTTSWESWDVAQSINNRRPEDVLQRFALRKLRPIVEELLKQKPQSMEAAA